MSVSRNGAASSFSNLCGSAAGWCLAAPGDTIKFPSLIKFSDSGTTRFQYGYRSGSGTSLATPFVSGALAALKSLFPSLSYQDLRDRILVTANKEGIYADEAIYGQGLLDLDAASRPVGGTGFAVGAFDSGTVAPTESATAILPAAAIARYLAGREILVLDNYQRAPFMVPLDSFIQKSGPRLSLDDLAIDTPAAVQPETPADGARLAAYGDRYAAGGKAGDGWFSGMARGARVLTGLARLTGARPSGGVWRMADDALGATAGLTGGAGEFQASVAAGAARTPHAGMAGWAPDTVLTAAFAARGGAGRFGASFATGLKRPMGWHGSGALALSGNAVEIFHGRTLAAGDGWRLGAAGRIAHLAIEDGPLLRFDDPLIAAGDLDFEIDVGSNATFAMRVGIERAATPAKGALRAGSRIHEDGRIDYRDIPIDAADFLALDKFGFGLGYAPSPRWRLRAGALAISDGFGETEAIAGATARLRF